MKPTRLSERCGVSTAEKSVRLELRRCRRSWRSVYRNDGEKTGRKKTPRKSQEAWRKRARARRAAEARARPPPTQGRARRAAAMDTAEIAEAFRRFQAATPAPKTELQVRQPVHAAGRGGAVGAGDRCRRQQGDAGFVRARRHAGKDGRARRGARARPDQDHRAVSHQGEERGGAVASGWSPSTAGRCRARARRWRRCPASAARPPTWCSTSPSASRPSRSTPTFSASATAPAWPPARIRSRSSRSSKQVVPAQYKRHAHHWLILHGRYTCLARKPLCERCVIADLCKWPGKTVAEVRSGSWRMEGSARQSQSKRSQNASRRRRPAGESGRRLAEGAAPFHRKLQARCRRRHEILARRRRPAGQAAGEAGAHAGAETGGGTHPVRLPAGARSVSEAARRGGLSQIDPQSRGFPARRGPGR